MIAPIKDNEQKRRLIHRFPASIHAVVLLYHTAHRRARHFGDPDAFFGGDDGAAVAEVALHSVCRRGDFALQP